MSNPIKHGATEARASFERGDIGAKGVVYFLLAIAGGTVLIAAFLVGLFYVLDKRERAQQPAVNALITNAPADTRHVPEKYADKAFPDPRLETNERGQLDDIRLPEDEKLSSYGWADEKAGTVHIPIERAMELLAQRGLPTRGGEQSVAGHVSIPVVEPPVKARKRKKL
jgi:hypothetical protein